jgi:predicted transcriptional regulator
MSRPLRIRWRSAIWSEDGPETNSQRSVATVLAEFMDAEGRGAFPSERTLEARTKLNRRTVRSALVALIGGGWLTANDTGRKGKYGKALRVYAAQIPHRLNGVFEAPLQSSLNGASETPLPAATNGAADPSTMVQVQRANGASSAPDPAGTSRNGSRSASPPNRLLNRSRPRLRSSAEPERVNDSFSEMQKHNPEVAAVISDIAAKLRLRQQGRDR